MGDGKKLAVLFPGVGYTCDKPLLYYGGKLMEQKGYEVIRLRYHGFPEKIRGDMAKMKESFFLALRQTKEALEQVSWGDYEDIIFLSKSIGTIVAAAYAQEQGLAVKQVLLTPLSQTFDFLEKDGDAFAFHGTSDPWAVTAEIEEACGRLEIPLYLTEGANHSLETGDAQKDIEILAETIRRIGRSAGI